MLVIDKVKSPQPVGPMTIYKHDIPETDLRRAAAADEDFYNGRLHEAHVMRLHGSYVVFSKNEPLPAGGFSDNYVGVHSHRGYVAVKRLRTLPSAKRDEKARCDWTPEAAIDKEVEWAQRVGLDAAPYFAVQTKTKAYIVSPLFEGDAMYLAALGETRFPRAVLLHRFVHDITKHLQHMHKNGILHNDVKPNNVLVARQAGDLRFVLCDYGLSCPLEPHDYQGGNAFYGAPEETVDFLPEARSDVFSLGLSCMALINAANPFDAIFSKFSGGLPPEDVRKRAYASFEAARRGTQPPADADARMFVACWQSIQRQVPPAWVELIRAMVACPLSGPAQRIGTQAILQRLPACLPDQESLAGWARGVAMFDPGVITNAKRQARIIEDALINRGRLEAPERRRETVAHLEKVEA